MESLPSEIIFNITLYLEPIDIVHLQHVSKRLLSLARDDNLWREQCFKASPFLSNIQRRKALLIEQPGQEPRIRDLARALADGNGLGESRLTLQPHEEARDLKAQSNERIRLRANWDPSYPEEKVNWYEEYIARNAPISTSWFEQPRNRESIQHEYLEVRGLALYKEPGSDGATLAVAPLDDGSICLWDIMGIKARKGSIVARSKPGILAVESQSQSESRSKMISTGVTECISVDSALKRAYVAVQSGLVEIDLETLSVVGYENFPFSITALSEARHPVPVTVGTNLSLYLHDPRLSQTAISSSNLGERVDSYAARFPSLQDPLNTSFRTLLNPDPSPEYAPLYQPGPLSILHLPSSGSNWDGNGDIYVAGRFPSILNYDRRYFPKLRGTIYSGARLCSMASLPHPFARQEKDLARRGELSVEQVYEAKTRPGKTLIACGEYNSKGSLEMYGLSPQPDMTTISSDPMAGNHGNATMKNRQTSSSSKLLSVASHGTRIVVSDGGGNIRWLERDGFTQSRKWNIATGSVEAARGIFGTLGDSYMDTGNGDIVLKILEHQGDLILWTGEKLGLLSFTSQPGFTAESFENIVKTPEEARQEREEQTYSSTMRRALEHQANEVRYVRGLGLGLGVRRASKIALLPCAIPPYVVHIQTSPLKAVYHHTERLRQLHKGGDEWSLEIQIYRAFLEGNAALMGFNGAERQLACAGLLAVCLSTNGLAALFMRGSDHSTLECRTIALELVNVRLFLA